MRQPDQDLGFIISLQVRYPEPSTEEMSKGLRATARSPVTRRVAAK